MGRVLRIDVDNYQDRYLEPAMNLANWQNINKK